MNDGEFRREVNFGAKTYEREGLLFRVKRLGLGS
jgi:hypothetical protein